jgi:Fe-S cluster biogenesis protein NfuA
LSTAVERVVELFDEMVKPEGGRVGLLAVDGGTLRVEYAKGVNEECETCVFEPDALAMIMQDMVKDHDPSIVEVVVTEVTT